MNNGFVKVMAATPRTAVADCQSNGNEIITLIKEAEREGAEIAAIPELCVTTSSCGDLFGQLLLIENVEKAINSILEASIASDCIIVAGAPVICRGSLFNSAVVMYRGKIAGISTKSHPTSDELRWFASGDTLPADATATLCGQQTRIGSNIIYRTPLYTFGVEIGNDGAMPIPTGTLMALAGAEIIVNIAATSEEANRHTQTKNAIAERGIRSICGCIYTNAGYGESTSRAVFSGYNAIFEKGETLAESKRFATHSHYSVSEIDVEKLRNERRKHHFFDDKTLRQEFNTIYIEQKPSDNNTLTRHIDPTPFIPKGENSDSVCEEIFTIQAAGLAKRIEHTGAKKCLIGISGGLDSTLALLATAKALDMIGRPHSDILAVTMPGFGTSNRTHDNALALMRQIGVTAREISIKEACLQHFKDIEHRADLHDVTFENAQARERTQILMDIANQCSGIVIGTDDLSELALGWATFNGDHISMYGLNASVPKTLIQCIVRWVAETTPCKESGATLLDIVNTPISPELTPADECGNIKQKTEDLVGPYELHDFFLYHFINHCFTPAKIFFLAQKAFEGTHDKATIKKWLTIFFRRFFAQQFKRSCSPDGPKTGNCNLSPQGGWLMPSDTSARLWIKECEEL